MPDSGPPERAPSTADASRPAGTDAASDSSAMRVQAGVPTPPAINPNAPRRARRAYSVDEFVEGIRSGDRVVLSQAISLVESVRAEDQQKAQALIDRCLPHAGDALRVGISGVPGVGKSTFIEALGTRLTASGRRLAVLTIDPSSTRTHGSILGDKTRMPKLANDPKAFVRPSATAGSLGGVARKTREVMVLCEAAGYDTVFVETVGVGQSETSVRSMVDAFLLLALAGAGDELQGIKRGIMEMADLVVVNKADGDAIEASKVAARAYRNALHLYPPTASGWEPPVLRCSALTGEGLAAVWDTVTTFEEHLRTTGFLARQRAEQATYWMHQTINDELHRRFYAHPEVKSALGDLEAAVRSGRRSPFTAATELIARYRQPATPPPADPAPDDAI